MSDPAIAAIEFALETDDGLQFLRLWMYGEFDDIRRNWPDCPKECFIGAEVGFDESKWSVVLPEDCEEGSTDSDAI